MDDLLPRKTKRTNLEMSMLAAIERGDLAVAV